MEANYNTDVAMWRNYRDSWLNQRRDVKIVVVDGHVHVSGEGYMARFADTETAIKCLDEAGFVENDFRVQA